jgi:hypothetical protein
MCEGELCQLVASNSQKEAEGPYHILKARETKFSSWNASSTSWNVKPHSGHILATSWPHSGHIQLECTPGVNAPYGARL